LDLKMTNNELIELIGRVLPLFVEDTESYAECCTIGATGFYEDMDSDGDRLYVKERRELAAQIKYAINQD